MIRKKPPDLEERIKKIEQRLCKHHYSIEIKKGVLSVRCEKCGWSHAFTLSPFLTNLAINKAYREFTEAVHAACNRTIEREKE